MRLQGRGSSAHKEGVANVCWPHVSWEIVYSRFVVHYHGDDDHGGGCNPDTRVSNIYAEVYIVTMMRMAMMMMRVVIISSLMGCGELGSW